MRYKIDPYNPDCLLTSKSYWNQEWVTGCKLLMRIAGNEWVHEYIDYGNTIRIRFSVPEHITAFLMESA